MHASSLLLLIGAAGMVAILHSILPDHWVPLAVVARAQRWNLLRVGKLTFLASLGHVLSSLVLGGVIAFIGLQFQQEIDTQQGHIVGIVLVATGLIFLVLSLLKRSPHGHQHGEGGHSHSHSFFAVDHGHDHDSQAAHDHEHNHDSQAAYDREHDHGHSHDHHEHTHAQQSQQPLHKRLAAIVVPFGVAASPDLTILPVALAASAVGKMAVVSVLGVFSLVTILTFVGLTLLATIVGYQIKGAWIEKHATTITALVLIGVGIVAFVGF